jgi:hypothetical protein
MKDNYPNKFVFEAEKFNVITCDIQDCITPYEIDFKIG